MEIKSLGGHCPAKQLTSLPACMHEDLEERIKCASSLGRLYFGASPKRR